MYTVVEAYGLGKKYRKGGFGLISPRHAERPWKSPPNVATIQVQDFGDVAAFLAVPFSEDIRSTLRISQGWHYNDRESQLHPDFTEHKGCDFQAPIGTPVLAAADGVALGSYHLSYLDDCFNRKTRERDMEQGKRMAFGLGQFVLVWHDKARVFTLYAHLQEINREVVPYFPPVEDGEDWNPAVIMQPVEAMMATTNSQGYYPQKVKRGDLLGLVGVSGLSLEGDGESPGFIPDQRLYPTWDPARAHLHFEVYTREPDGSAKKLRWDPWERYGEELDYRDFLTSPTRGLFLPDPDSGWSQFAG